MSMNRHQIQKRLNTVMSKLDEVLSNAAITGALDRKETQQLVKARELVLSVEGPLYQETTA